MISRFAWPMLAVLLLTGLQDVQAQQNAVDITRFKPSPDSDVDLLATQTLELLPPLDWSAGLILHYAHVPLRSTFPDGTGVELISSQTIADVLFSIGIVESFEVGVALPVVLLQSGVSSYDDGDLSLGNLETTQIGDLRLTPRFLFQDLDDLRLGISGSIIFPTGDEKSLLSDNAYILEVRLLVDYHITPQHLLAFNVGSRSRDPRRLNNLLVSQELLFNIGYQYTTALQGMELDLLASLEGAMGTVVIDNANTAIELLAAARLDIGGGISLTAGAGPGLTGGVGTPVFRAFIGASYAHRTPPPPPFVCELGDEDLDGFQDDDACADPDNDEDGIIDADDRCPFEPESHNGLRDEDGCPEVEIMGHADPAALPRDNPKATLDADGDGISDADDLCADEPEDPDAFEDADGCPEPDNDRDGILDAQDQCPLDAEIINGNLDQDGCPDEGASKIRITTTHIEILESIEFSTGKSRIRKTSLPLLDQVATALANSPQITRILIEGHTDNRGKPDDNLTLSRDRAKAVLDYLVAKGIDAERLRSEGYGQTRPIEDNTTRRVQFTILEVNGVSIAPTPPPPETHP